MAAYYLGLTGFPKPTDQELAWWNSASQPTRLPVLTFDFQRLSAAYAPTLSREFGRLRLSHPILGRPLDLLFAPVPIQSVGEQPTGGLLESSVFGLRRQIAGQHVEQRSHPLL